MIKRWIIRSIFILLIALCIAGWGYSVDRRAEVQFNSKPFTMSCYTGWGVIACNLIRPGNEDADSGLQYAGGRLQSRRMLRLVTPGPNFQGLGYYHTADFGNYWSITLPYWFLILLFAGGLAIACWKTRRKPDPATAFPVQPLDEPIPLRRSGTADTQR